MVTVPTVNGEEPPKGVGAPKPEVPTSAPKDAGGHADRIERLRGMGGRKAPMSLSQVSGMSPDDTALAVRIAERSGMNKDAARYTMQHGLDHQREALKYDYEGVLAKAPFLRRWIAADRVNAAIGRDDLGPLSGIENSFLLSDRSRSWLGEVRSAAAEGFIGLEAAYYHMAALRGLMSLEDAAAGVARVNQRLAESRAGRGVDVQKYFQDIDRAEGLGVIPAALSDATGFSVLLAENLGFSSPALVGGALGTLVAPGAGTVGGAFVGGVFTEFGAWVGQGMGERGVNMTDPNAILAAYQDAEFMAMLDAQATRKGLGTASIDAVSMLLGGRLLAGARGAGGRLRAVGREVVEQTVGESVGEAVGQLAATGEVDAKEALLEGIAALGTSGAEIALGVARRMPGGVKRMLQRGGEATQAVQDAEGARATAKAWTESAAAKRLPERVRDLVKVMAQRGEQSFRFDREAWDAYWQGQDTSPAEAAAAAMPEVGVKVYAEAATTGEIEIPFDAFIATYADSPHFEPLMMDARLRPQGVTLAEAEEFFAEAEAAAEADAEQTVTLYQEQQDLSAELAELEAELEGLGEDVPRGTEALSALPPEAVRQVADIVESFADAVSSGTVPESLARQTAQEAASGIGALTGVDLTETLAAAQTDAPGFVAGLRAAARRTEAQTRRAEIQGRQSEIAAAEQARADEGDAFEAAMTEAYIAAGRPKTEAAKMAIAERAVAEAFVSRDPRLSVKGLAERFRREIGRRGGPTTGVTLGQGEGGTFSFDPGSRGEAIRTFVTRLFGGADRSTALHEGAHAWFEILGDLAEDADASPAIVEMWATTLEWLGVESRAELTTAHYERFARGFEAIVLEGKAPSERMRPVFAAFSSWLTAIYKTIKGLEAAAGQPINLSDDMRRVFDRLLATDEEIAAAAYEIGSETVDEALLSALPEDKQAGVRAAQQAAADEAREAHARALATEEARIERAMRSERLEEIRGEVAAEVNSRPAVQTYDALVAEDGAKIARESVQTDEAREALDGLGLLADEGVDVAAAMEEADVDSEDALVAAMRGASQRDRLIDTAARARLRAEVASTLDTRKGRQALARRHVTGVKQLERAEAELKVAQELAEQESAERRSVKHRIPPLSAFRERAAARLRFVPVRDLRPDRHTGAARRASRRFMEKMAAKKYSEAVLAKQQELFNLMLAAEATKLRDQYRKDLRRTQRLLRDGTEPWKRLVRAKSQGVMRTVGRWFGLSRDDTPVAPDDRADLAEWMLAREAEGTPIAAAEWLLDETQRKSHRDLTAAQMHDVRELMDGIQGLADMRHEALTGDRTVTIDQRAAAVAETVRASKKKRTVIPGAETKKERLLAGLDGFFAGGTKAGTYARMFDQDTDGGAAQRFIVRPINEGVDNRSVLHRKMHEDFAALYTDHLNEEERKTLNVRHDYGGVALTREDRLSVLGLMGTAEGRQRVAQILTPEQLALVLSSFNEREVALVEAKWAYWNPYYEQAKAQHAEIAGQEVKDAAYASLRIRTQEGRDVVLDGGYHPLAYKDARPWSETFTDWQKATTEGSAPAAMLDLGFLKTRKAKVTGRVRLDVGPQIGHIADMAHTLTMRKAIIDVQRVLQHPDVHGAIQEHYGTNAVKELRAWLSDIAAGDKGSRNDLERGLAYLRHGAVIANLGFRMKSALVQFFGFRQTMIYLGPKWTMAGLSRLFREPGPRGVMQTVAWVMENSKFMAERPKGSWQRELNEMSQRMPSKLRSGIMAANFYLISKAQQAVDMMTWLGAYEKAMAAQGTGVEPDAAHTEAVARADQAVKDTQGGGQAVDLSWWERGPPLVRILTTFMTETALKFNLTRVSASRTVWNAPLSVAKFMSDFALLYMFEAIAVSLVAAWASDDDDDESVTGNMLAMTAAAMLDTMPLLRELSGQVRGYPYRGPAGLTALAQIGSAGQQIMQGELDGALWRNLNLAAGELLHYPARSLNEVVESIDQVMSGEAPTRLVGGRRDR